MSFGAAEQLHALDRRESGRVSVVGSDTTPSRSINAGIALVAKAERSTEWVQARVVME